MSSTLITIVLLLAVATALAIIQARRRDRCLKSFGTYHVTLAEKDGDLSWGTLTVEASGLEISYDEPVRTRAGHLERSFLFYKDQYETMDALYRAPEALPAEEQEHRAEVIRQTARPGTGRRLLRRLRNWIGMVRDALVKSVGLVLGATKAGRPGTAVLASQEQGLTAISGEVIGHAGNAYDPLLEHHIYRQVVVEVTRDGLTHSYCGWLKDYTSQFVEVVDAYANAFGVHVPERWYAPDPLPAENETPAPFRVHVTGGRVVVINETDYVLSVHRVEAGAWSRALGCVLPPGYTAGLPLPEDADPEALRVEVSTAEHVDLVVPRAHAIVRHAADGSEALAHRPHGTRGVVASTLQNEPAPSAAPPPEPVPA